MKQVPNTLFVEVKKWHIWAYWAFIGTYKYPVLKARNNWVNALWCATLYQRKKTVFWFNKFRTLFFIVFNKFTAKSKWSIWEPGDRSLSDSFHGRQDSSRAFLAEGMIWKSQHMKNHMLRESKCCGIICISTERFHNCGEEGSLTLIYSNPLPATAALECLKSLSYGLESLSSDKAPFSVWF